MIPSGKSVPAFTVLEDFLDAGGPRNPERPLWMSMYENATMSNRSQQGNSSLLNSYHNTNHNFMPTISPTYEEIIEDNAQDQYLLNRQGLPSIPPRRLEESFSLPEFNPPYGTPYPSKGYSFSDASASFDSSQIQATARPPVPVSSIPALIDARDSPSVPIDQAYFQAYRDYANRHFREGFRLGTEQRSPNCPDIVHHISSCSLCKTVVKNQEKFLISTIGFLGIIIIILIILLLKKH